MNITINSASTFLICNEFGDIIPGSELGLYDFDTRYLNQFELSFSGYQFNKMAGRKVDFYSAVHYLANPKTETLDEDKIEVSRQRFVGEGLHEDMDITNYNEEKISLSLALKLDTDFADIFEVKTKSQPAGLEIKRFFDEEINAYRMIHKNSDFYRETRIELSERPANGENGALAFDIELEQNESWHICIDIFPMTSQGEIETEYRCGEFDIAEKEPVAEHWKEEVATIKTNDIILQEAYSRSISDLAALRQAGVKEDYEEDVPVTGIPWFMTHFGRDSLITSIQTLFIAPGIAKSVLRALAYNQGTKIDEPSEEEPGKILHEVRLGRLATHMGTQSYKYFGTIDATPLFVITMHDYCDATGDIGLASELKPQLILALQWLDEFGDLDNDGYLEYKRKTSSGLLNQNWKDSKDSTLFRSGVLPEPPLAPCEVQGYAYAAKLKGAVLLRLLGETDLANKYRSQARILKERFNKDFWMDGLKFFAQALDKDKKQVDSMTSNAGHLLWSGIADAEKAAYVARRLLSPEFFSGWGIRTLTDRSKHYNPMSYHNGSVWPHDNSLIAAGLLKYGHTDEALKILSGLTAASKYFDEASLPELFCGFNRELTLVPIDYTTSNKPQAWAAGSIPFILTSMLGISIQSHDGKRTVKIDPKLPQKIDRLLFKRLFILDQKVDILITRIDGIIKTKLLNKHSLDIES